MSSIDKTWNYINKTRTESDWLESIDDWNKLEKMREEHKDCKNKIKSWCDIELCVHLKDYVSDNYGFCSWCDYMVQPMLANPKNKEYVLKYCQLGANILYPNDIKNTYEPNLQKIEECWKRINEYTNKQDYINSIEEWNNIQEDMEINNNHKNNTKKIYCKCCRKHISESVLSNQHIKEKICIECDNYIIPFLSNPNNKKYIIKYCPLGREILYPSDYYTDEN